MSSVWPMRPSDDCDSIHLRKSPSTKPAEWTPSVSIMPGLMELTRILRGPSSLESTTVMASTEALVAEYVAVFGGRMVLAPEPILMMLPPSGADEFHGFFRGEQETEDVDVELFVEQLLGDCFERRECVYAGIVDQDVELAKSFFRFSEKPGDVGLFGDIALDGDGFPSC